jgi:uncharacterized Fe-S cluster-containing radical SAM superfamily enzyme
MLKPHIIMAKLEFQDLEFSGEKDRVKITFLKNYYFFLGKQDLEAIGRFKVGRNSISFDASDKRAGSSFNFLLQKGFEGLKSSISGRKTVYVHRNSGIPLIGSNFFGLVDRNTNLIEVKPLTGCNLNCIFCSVDEGISSKKAVDFVVEKDYLVEEFSRLAGFKQCSQIEANINPHGEPLLYAPLAELVHGLAQIPNVKAVSMDTNGILLTKAVVDRLAAAGMTQINLSLNAVTRETASRLAGIRADPARIIEIARYIPKKMLLNIAPILVPGINEADIEAIILLYMELAAKHPGRVKIGIQNFMSYQRGRNPVRQLPMEDFFKKLGQWEARFGVRLVVSKEDFNITETRKLPLSFRKDETIKAAIMCPGRYTGEAVAAARGRAILVRNCHRLEGEVKARILRTKHNIYSAIAL